MYSIIKDSNYKYFDNVYKNVAFFIFVGGLVSLFVYLAVYSFLYGYYFGGEEKNYYSDFLYYSNFINFNPETFSITTTYFLGMFYLIKSWQEGIIFLKQKNKNTIFPLVILSVLILISMNIFFVGEITINGFLSHFLFFLLICIFFYNVYIAILFIYDPGYFLHLIFQAIILSAIVISNLNGNNIALIYMTISLALPSLINFSTNNLTSFISYITLGYFLYSGVTVPSNNILTVINWVIALMIIIGIYLVKSFISVTTNNLYIQVFSNINTKTNRVQNKLKIVDEYKQKGLIKFVFDYILEIFRNENNIMSKIMITTIGLSIFLTFPQISLIMGKGIRSVNFVNDQKYNLEYIEKNGIEKSEPINYYLIKDESVYYSNSNWELEVIKIDNYKIQIID